MKVTAFWTNLKTHKTHKVKMEVCVVCDIGVGITRYPDKEFYHYYNKLYEGMCRDCLHRFRSGALLKGLKRMLKSGGESSVAQAMRVIERMVKVGIVKRGWGT